jgi:4,5-DOPA dioxygenase extradiol
VTLPALFVSHGAPTLVIDDVPAHDFLKTLPSLLPEAPRAILMISAHWETPVPAVSTVAQPDTIHDFGGFPEALYRLQYPAPGAPELAARVVELLAAAGISAATSASRGLDHGAWVPLMLAWPDGQIPVTQLAVQTQLGAAHHYALGRALAPLRDEGVLIIGSGSFTHDLSEFRRSRLEMNSPEPGWVTGFADWMDTAIVGGRTDDLLAYRRLAPEAVHNHPTEEHLLPLHVALGAGGQGRRIHQSTTFGILRMDAYAFE